MNMEYYLDELFDLQMGKTQQETTLNIGIQMIINGFPLVIFLNVANILAKQKNSYLNKL